MSFVGSYNFKGINLESAVVRQAYHPQLFKEEGRVHLIFELFASQEAIDAGEKPLIDRFLEVDVWTKLPKGHSESESRESHSETIRVTKANKDLRALWGKQALPKDYPSNIWAQGYKLVEGLNSLSGFVSDEVSNEG